LSQHEAKVRVTHEVEAGLTNYTNDQHKPEKKSKELTKLQKLCPQALGQDEQESDTENHPPKQHVVRVNPLSFRYKT
jgi:hypothetical protein